MYVELQQFGHIHQPRVVSASAVASTWFFYPTYLAYWPCPHHLKYCIIRFGQCLVRDNLFHTEGTCYWRGFMHYLTTALKCWLQGWLSGAREQWYMFGIKLHDFYLCEYFSQIAKIAKFTTCESKWGKGALCFWSATLLAKATLSESLVKAGLPELCIFWQTFTFSLWAGVLHLNEVFNVCCLLTSKRIHPFTWCVKQLKGACQELTFSGDYITSWIGEANDVHM